MHRILVTVLSLLAASSPVLAQTVTLRPSRPRTFPAQVDSNSPALWQNGELVIYNSTGLGPVKSVGRDQYNLTPSRWVTLGPSTHRPYWIEATWIDTDGTIFAWYHHEPPGVCGRLPLTAPQIGALVSYDGGDSFLDLGIILESTRRLGVIVPLTALYQQLMLQARYNGWDESDATVVMRIYEQLAGIKR